MGQAVCHQTGNGASKRTPSVLPLSQLGTSATRLGAQFSGPTCVKRIYHQLAVALQLSRLAWKIQSGGSLYGACIAEPSCTRKITSTARGEIALISGRIDTFGNPLAKYSLVTLPLYLAPYQRRECLPALTIGRLQSAQA